MKPSTFLQIVLFGRAACLAPRYPLKIETRGALNSRLANIHFERQHPVEGPIGFTFGSCEATHQQRNAEQTIGKTTKSTHDRLVWLVPQDTTSGGCISAWSELTGLLVGRSEPQNFDLAAMEHRRSTRLSRRGIRMDNSTGIDV